MQSTVNAHTIIYAELFYLCIDLEQYLIYKLHRISFKFPFSNLYNEFPVNHQWA